jgi:predicted small metal-binding protein
MRLRKERTMKTLACGEIMEGCPATFAAETDEALLAQAGRHAAEVHGLVVTPEVVELVRGHIRDDGESNAA